MKNKITNIIKEAGYSIESEEVEFAIDRLIEILLNQKESEDISKILSWIEEKRKKQFQKKI